MRTNVVDWYRPIVGEIGPVRLRHSLADELLPAYDHRQRFSTLVPAPRAAVFEALRQVRFSDLRLLRPLMLLRSLGGSEQQDADDPIFTGTTLAEYVWFEERPEREIVIGVMGPFWTMNAFAPIQDREAFVNPSDATYVRTTSSVILESQPGGTQVTVENRVKDPADATAARKFHLYWYLMGQIGAAAFALSLLDAVKRRGALHPEAEAAPTCGRCKVTGVLGVAAAFVAGVAVIRLLRRTRGCKA